MVFNLFKKSGEPSKEAHDELKPAGPADLLKYIVVKLVDNPDDVEVKVSEGEKNTVLELKVNEDDMGKVIGKKGRIIKSLRIVVKAAAIHSGKSVSVELANDEISRPV